MLNCISCTLETHDRRNCKSCICLGCVLLNGHLDLWCKVVIAFDQKTAPWVQPTSARTALIAFSRFPGRKPQQGGRGVVPPPRAGKHAPLSDGGDAAAQERAQLLHQLLRAEGIDGGTSIRARLPLLLVLLLLPGSRVPF